MAVSPLWARTISVRRPNNNVTPVAGATGYGGADPIQETIVLSNQIASISFDRTGRADPAGLPTDSKLPFYIVSIPYSFTLPAGSIHQNDVIVDDTGQRYQVIAVDWQPLGYTLYVQILLD